MHYSLTGFFVIISILSTVSYVLVYSIMNSNMLGLPPVFSEFTF